ncbi:thioredoxin family protein [Amycolatopsis acidiphila]|uniref:Thioredoxin family protein n=1 Tax=Amycolatopsis acidiphila TaxID=715473 RepID=A0A558A2I1_9PSEU|nr:thioredoxin family protein [Amycolatopsis acidiphila]TVT18462.1 thioredoxin family protein [Amycolatopsis acidiphila]UIJ60025.1 thioredoxin family protein [Amycolatopsis acidiphila]GHG61798.1 thiol reductase thioredoxin [Amycolatopsis acidiphila]
MVGVWVVLGVLLVGGIAGAALRARNGRIRTAKARERALPEPVAQALDPGAAVTLVQISTTFCAPCRHTKAILSPLAERTEGLRHVELDVTDQPEVAQALGVLRTPTTLAFSPDGTELLRISGVPKGPAVLEALDEHLSASSTGSTR